MQRDAISLIYGRHGLLSTLRAAVWPLSYGAIRILVSLYGFQAAPRCARLNIQQHGLCSKGVARLSLMPTVVRLHQLARHIASIKHSYIHECF